MRSGLFTKDLREGSKKGCAKSTKESEHPFGVTGIVCLQDRCFAGNAMGKKVGWILEQPPADKQP